MERISSRQNPIVKRFRALINPSPDFMLLDGPHLLDEAIASGVTIDIVAVRETSIESPLGVLAQRAARSGARLIGVSDSVLAAISPVRQPSGVVAIARRRGVPLEAVLDNPPQLLMMLVDVQDPGNVGAIVRSADACGATGVITFEGSADPFGWKAVRGSMGSIFRVPVAPRQRIEPAVRTARQQGIHVYAAIPTGGIPLPECDLRKPAGILLGGEGAGLPAQVIDLADQKMSIPMRRPVESLNVATAGAIIVYEAQRQRDGGTA